MIAFLISAIKIIILLGVLITIHELGHFIVAKWCNVKVNEFAIGFGPKIWQKEGKETKYTLRLIPLGGYNSLEGEEGDSQDDRAFSNASILKRIAIVIAGATVNIIFAIVLYFTLASLLEDVYISNEIDSVIDGYPAQMIGLQQGDKIIQINDNNIKDNIDLNKSINKSNGEEVKIKVERNGKILEYSVKPTLVPINESIEMYYIGVNLKPAEDTFFNHLAKGVKMTKEFMISIVDSLKQLFSGKVGINQMMGPVGISQVIAKTNGISEFFEMMALISLSLGVTNLLPLPAWDGGKILILLIEGIRRKPLKPQTEINLQLMGFAFLIALSIIVTYKDIVKIF